MKADILVTRHMGLVEFLREIGLIDENTPIISHISDPAVIEGKVVIGNLPFHLAAKAKAVIVPILELTPELRGKDLDKETLKKVCKGFEIYEVKKLGRL